MFKIHSRNTYINNEFIDATITIDKNVIKDIEKGYSKDAISFGDNYIIPGLIDIHTHGYAGYSANNDDIDGLINWTKYLPSEGVTSFVPTTSTAPKEALFKSFKTINKVKEDRLNTSKILGINVEGPFISKDKAGAQDLNNIQKPSRCAFEEYYEKADGNICLITIAPEEDDGFEMLKAAKEKRVIVSIGHTNTTSKVANDYLDAGAQSFTHTFNAMSGFSHRDSGCAVSAMIRDDAYAELICDGVHVEKQAAQILARCKPTDKLILITDAICAKGLDNGRYTIDNMEVFVLDDGSVRDRTGRLAGSANCLNKIVDYAVNIANIDIARAINAATINPATLLNIDNIALIKPGYRADLVVCDKRFNIIKTYIDGKEIYSR